ncbi:hypothetical protein [Serratia fonticola]|uniref:hypothetical protein n=1 Tax=Serratia fonticola TaxID=47917 RepID=UPI00217AE8AF|nr:hypothetical protein [Serratia fonticola]CAI1543939.1 Uncharacterised protein [Serratia fonticola]
MKKLINVFMLTLVALISAPSFANPDDSCDGEQTIFSAVTQKGNKFLQTCFVYGDVRYVFGKINTTKQDIILNVPLAEVKYKMGNDWESFTIPNGDYAYEVYYPMKGYPAIIIYKNDQQIGTVDLNHPEQEFDSRFFNN